MQVGLAPGRRARPPFISLLRALGRAIDWTPLGVAAVVTALLALVVDVGAANGLELALLLARMSGLMLGAAAAFALVDAMTASTGPTPVPRWLRQWMRTLLAFTVAAAHWAAVASVLALRLPAGIRLPLAGAAVEAAVCVMVGLAGAAVAVRRNQGRQAGLAGAITQLVLGAGTLFFGAGPWPAAGDPDWEVVHRGWAATLPVLALCLLMANRDLRGRPGVIRRRPTG
jgi:hypothetical protein